jgi:hypothetical protein
MRDLVLLGAGASADAGVPTAFAMTEAILGRFKEKEGAGVGDLALVLEYICESLSPHGTLGEGDHPGLDVEKVFSAVELLAERDSLEISPFIEAWSRGVDRWERRAATSRGENSYAALRDRMLIELRGLVGTTRKQISYLEPLVRFAADPARATIATLNYDLSIEGAAEACGIQVDTGIHRWVQGGHWSWRSDGVRLLKLHGSIDWAWEDDPAVDGRLPSRFIAQISTFDSDEHPPALIFGLRGKLRAEGPFLSALAEFESQLERASRLIVVGYSFRDDHVNQAIRRWTFDGRGRELVLVDPYLPASRPRKVPNMPFRESLLAYLGGTSTGGDRGTGLCLMRESAATALHALFKAD